MGREMGKMKSPGRELYAMKTLRKKTREPPHRKSE
jgi:hypothetical protein